MSRQRNSRIGLNEGSYITKTDKTVRDNHKLNWERFSSSKNMFFEAESTGDLKHLKELIQTSLQVDGGESCPLSIEELNAIYSKVKEDAQRKAKQVSKLGNSVQMPKLSSTNRGLSGKRQEDSEDERNASATKRQGVATDGKRFDKLQSDILKIEAKLNSVEDPQNLSRIEALVKAKETECDLLERKLRAMKALQTQKEQEDAEPEEEDPSDKHQFIKQMGKLQKEVKNYEDLHTKLQEQVVQKENNLRKHTEIVEKLYEKYKSLCEKADIEPQIKLEKNEEGKRFNQPQDSKLGRQIDIKKHSVEIKLTKSNKITDCQRKFATRVATKEIPAIQEWISKQAAQHAEIQNKIQRCNGLYERYTKSGNKSPIDSNVFSRFEKLREQYSKPFEYDELALEKIESLLQKLY